MKFGHFVVIKSCTRTILVFSHVWHAQNIVIIGTQQHTPLHKTNVRRSPEYVPYQTLHEWNLPPRAS